MLQECAAFARPGHRPQRVPKARAREMIGVPRRARMADGNGSGEAAQRHLRKDTGRQAGANGRCAPTSWRKLRVLDLAGGGSQIEGAAERMIDLMIGRMIGLMIGG